MRRMRRWGFDGATALNLAEELRAALADEEEPFQIAEVAGRDWPLLRLVPVFLEEAGLAVPRSAVPEVCLPEGAGPAETIDMQGIVEIRLPARPPIWVSAVKRDSAHGQIWIAVVAYRKREDLDWLLRELRALQARRTRERKLVVIGGTATFSPPTVGWDDLVLPDAPRRDIRESVEGFVVGRERYGRLGIAWRRGFLLVGPPGNGKTLLCKVIAGSAGLPFVYVQTDGSSDNRDVDVAFRLARDVAPSILCFEDLDTLFETEITLSHFLNKLDGFEDNTGLLVLATTNHPERLDQALLRRPSRFDRVWRLPDPDRALRARFLRRLFGAGIAEETIADVASRTERFSMAYLAEIKTVAGLRAARERRDAIEESDVLQALAVLRAQFRTAEAPIDLRAVGFGTADDGPSAVARSEFVERDTATGEVQASRSPVRRTIPSP